MTVKKIIRLLLFSLFALLVAVLLLELSFRYQIIDFYRSELVQLNPNLNKNSDKERVLIIGDSFSTFPNGYVDQLRKAHPNVQYINAAISGTGILQQRLYFKKRVKQFQPQKIIYQFYVGNDFLDIQPATNLQTLSIARNTYWWLSKRLLILQYINFRMAVFKGDKSSTFVRLQSDQFETKQYNPRVKTQFLGNSTHIENTLFLKKEAKRTYANWKNSFQEILSILPDSVEVGLLIIPHCAQVHPIYLERMISLGAIVEEDVSIISPPLYVQLTKDFPTVQLLNPLEFFQLEEERNLRLYFGNDPHLNSLGQQKLFNYLETNFSHAH